MRLLPGAPINDGAAGWVEVFSRGGWGRVCAQRPGGFFSADRSPLFPEEAQEVICRQLNYSQPSLFPQVCTDGLERVQDCAGPRLSQPNAPRNVRNGILPRARLRRYTSPVPI